MTWKLLVVEAEAGAAAASVMSAATTMTARNFFMGSPSRTCFVRR
jgi:hypothetical protein